MMTPNDVAQHGFDTVRFNGYNTNEVDEFMDQLTADYTALYKENAILKSKMKVLVDKIGEYRATEDDMRQTLLTARRNAEGIIAQAQQERQTMLREAETEVAARRQELRREINNSEAQLAAARQSTVDFVSGMRALVAQQQTFLAQETAFLDRLDEIKADEAPEEEAPPAKETNEAEDAMKSILSDEELAAEMAAAEAAAVQSPETAYAQEVPDLGGIAPDGDDPTRVMDLSSMSADQDYKV
ncbi:MAG: DivIVA domain-containing protein [Clostridiales bacterium]|nr:DivIVA domain-containing protein [Clostridiales bacterium]